MRHKKLRRKLSRPSQQRKALLRSLLIALFSHQKIVTTTPRAKEVKKIADKIITLAKTGDLHSRRQVLRIIPDKKLVKEIFEKIAKEVGDRRGGYTREIKYGTRRGDGASLSLVEIVK